MLNQQMNFRPSVQELDEKMKPIARNRQASKSTKRLSSLKGKLHKSHVVNEVHSDMESERARADNDIGSSRYEDSATLLRSQTAQPNYLLSGQLRLREERNEQVNKIGINGFFQLLRIDSQLNAQGGSSTKLAIVPPDAINAAQRINIAEMDLNMESVRTIVSTIVSLRRPNHDPTLLSEKLLFSTSLQDKKSEYQTKMGELRNDFQS